jgi:hypothetical protein
MITLDERRKESLGEMGGNGTTKVKITETQNRLKLEY